VKPREQFKPDGAGIWNEMEGCLDKTKEKKKKDKIRLKYSQKRVII